MRRPAPAPDRAHPRRDRRARLAALAGALALQAAAPGCAPAPAPASASARGQASASAPAPAPAPAAGSAPASAAAPAPATTLVRPKWTIGKPPPPDKPTVTVRPRVLHDVLVNPGMGIQTFQRFNGQALNPGLTGPNWSEAGPITRLPDLAMKPDFPDSSVAYLRWHWATLEPERGKIRWEILDLALEEARRHGQTLAIRLMPYDRDVPLPGWYRASGARRANAPAGETTGSIWEPDYTDPLYLKHWGALVAAVGERYDGHPDLESVDIASIGYWGEGWSDHAPPVAIERRLIDVYFGAFKETPLLVNDQPNVIDHAVGRGAGLRLDCWGDMRSSEPNVNWSHMLDSYPELVARPAVREAWRRRPVSLETCGVVGDWLAAGWDIDYILEQALAWHASTINVKSSAIPPEWKGKFDDFARRLGYRLVLRRLEHPKEVKAGGPMRLKLWWQNAGVAPVYRPYALTLELRAAGAAGAVELPLDVRTLLPGDATWEGEVRSPAGLAPGTYALRLALVDPRTRAPAIRLAIEGREPDGWYRLGTIEVEAAERSARRDPIRSFERRLPTAGGG
ncbi:uncharacterized protein SOCEGT47_062000 [Sorangium cellulosum]|uniref:DUF4832 domain-containing protein n=1 Tax=Sorangium cellulosum TaxID=56 RepID=A0A4P2Q8R7_SORCE|nr:DUF4832 domain-containing protein [Sorangium cellulosum]AUX25651.1 uncharacterized protein SOCEGT47_062000 [Sorangium cellulosum]